MGHFKKTSFGGGRRDGGGGRRDGGGRTEMHQATCADCGNRCEVPFKPTGNKPVLCRDCFGGGRDGGRDGKRDFGRGGRDSGRSRGRDFGGDRQMHKATCSECGSSCEVPFRPSGNKPVFCSNCFEESGGGKRGGGSRGGAKHDDQHAMINKKLDLILKILEPITEMELIDANASGEIDLIEDLEEDITEDNGSASSPSSRKDKKAKKAEKKENGSASSPSKKTKKEKKTVKKAAKKAAPKKAVKKPAKKATPKKTTKAKAKKK